MSANNGINLEMNEKLIIALWELEQNNFGISSMQMQVGVSEHITLGEHTHSHKHRCTQNRGEST